MSVNLMNKFTHENERSKVYCGMALTAFSAGALFMRSEAVKIIAMTVITTQASITANMLLIAHYFPHYKVKEILNLEPEGKDKYILFGINSFRRSFPLTLVFGCMFAICSRGMASKFKYQVSAKHLAPLWITILALGVIITEIGVRKSTPYDFEAFALNEPDTFSTSRYLIFELIFLSSFLAINVGIIAYRFGLFSKKS